MLDWTIMSYIFIVINIMHTYYVRFSYHFFLKMSLFMNYIFFSWRYLESKRTDFHWMQNSNIIVWKVVWISLFYSLLQQFIFLFLIWMKANSIYVYCGHQWNRCALNLPFKKYTRITIFRFSVRKPV